MGNVVRSSFGKKRYRVLMLGLDNAGKTSILSQLHFKEFLHTLPTVGFTVELVTVKNVQFTVWDVGGQDKIRPLWRHYFTGSQGLIFVVDSSDYERIDEARYELEKILNAREMSRVSLLVLCNKQDLADSMQPDYIQKALNLEKFTRPYSIVPCSALHGTGLSEGLTWLSKHCK